MQVQLTWHEVFHAATVGAMRRIDALKKQRPTRFEPADGWGVDIDAACAELAVARALGRYWHAIVGNPNGLPGDAGAYQVRSTPHDGGHLVVYEHDDDDPPFVLVTGRAPTYTIRGWMFGIAAKQDQWWREDVKVPAYFVHQMHLQPMEELPR